MAMRDINPRIVPEHELDGIRKRGIRRAERRVEEREHLRLEIKARKLLEDTHTAVDKLFLGTEESPIEPGLIVPLTRDRIAAIKAGADIAAKLLNKVLPDLKQVEIRADEAKDAERILESIDIANRLRIYKEAVERRESDLVVVADTEPEFLK